jgi:formate/nitrite transporter FocA (FNT family)
MNLSIITFCFAIITFVGLGFKHIVLHAKISFYFSHGRVYTDKIAIESEMTDL